MDQSEYPVIDLLDWLLSQDSQQTQRKVGIDVDHNDLHFLF